MHKLDKCLTTTNFSIIMNGKPRGKFAASIGLRQGSLSPFQFTMVGVGDAPSRSIQVLPTEEDFKRLQSGEKSG